MGGQATVEPDLSDIGHGSDALMARTRMLGPNTQATTSTGLNYLLGEDNDNTRVPFNEGLSVKPSDSMMMDTTTGPFDFYNTDKFEEDSMTLLKGMYGTGKDSNQFLYNEMIKKGNELRKQGVDRETVIKIIRTNKNKIDEILRQQEFKDISPKSLAGLADGGRAAFGGGGTMGKTDRGYQGGGRDKKGSVSGTAPGAAAVGGGPDDRGSPQQNLNHLVAMHKYQNPSLQDSKINNLISTGQEVNYLRNLYKMDPIGLGISYGINRFGPSIMDKLRNLRSEAEIEDFEEDNYFLAAKGGIAGLRQGYSKGKGVDFARRGFLKVLAGTGAAVAAFKTGALKLLGKTTTKVAPKIFTAAEGSGAPAWFEGMVNKVLADGVDITKKASTLDGQIVKSLDTPTGKVDVTIDRTGNIDVNYMGDNTAMGEGVDMRYTVGQADETTKVKPFDEFEAVETIPEGRMYSPNDYQVEFGENATDQVKNLYSDVSELQALGGDKRLINDISVTLQKKKTLKKMNENPDQFASDNLPDDYPNYDYEDVNPDYD